MLSNNIQKFISQEVLNKFTNYVAVDTQSDPESENTPSSLGQWDLAKLLHLELVNLGLVDVELDDNCYLYATLPASCGVVAPTICFCSHMDTAPAESGSDVKPIIHKNYQGEVICFPDNPHLKLDPEQYPELKEYCGEDIITASGNTLLGADDKAGIAEIMTALATFQKFPELKHPPLKIIFTPDEEIGRGVDKINSNHLVEYGYTIDGGEMGEYEDECFDAYGVKISFVGNNIHPGYAKNKMVNAAAIATRFSAMLPQQETPENSELREGFYHLCKMSGCENEAKLEYIIRDFDNANNLRRISCLQSMVQLFEDTYLGLKIKLDISKQYSNMNEIICQYPAVTDKIVNAISKTGLHAKRSAIRGGTDGARLSFMQMPTPNIFTGGMNFHSKLEWIPVVGLQKATETIIHLCQLWADKTIE